MQENEPTGDHSDGIARSEEVGRHRAAPTRPARSVYIVPLAVALVGFGLAGVSALTTGTDSRPSVNAAAAIDEQARAAAAQRADRSRREPPSTSPTATTPTAAASSPAGPSTSPAGPSSSPASPSSKPSPKPSPKAAWVNPLPGAETTSCFGQRWGALHAGIDLAMPANTPIHAAAAGTVVEAGWAYSGYGISVVIDHGNGYLTHYAHQNRTAVRVGQKVAAGDVIGYEGSTGDSTGPHLHFEVHNGLWNQIDPAPWMRARGVNLGC